MSALTPPVPPGAWFKSSYSGAGTSECLETAVLPDLVAVRDSKDAAGPVLTFSRGSWSAFVASVEQGNRPNA
ncbi:DUF397 domain-containing protein [Streptomyces sp. NBC_01537]|uniref:DUF397 domain-containing protein n=1 Tax=Streptomyces sp. NBC_01537 TaxID=2903896 RepID=UPI0038660B55